MLTTAISSACLVCGCVLANQSLRDERRAAAFERWSGVCLVLGLGLLGAALRIAR